MKILAALLLCAVTAFGADVPPELTTWTEDFSETELYNDIRVFVPNKLGTVPTKLYRLRIGRGYEFTTNLSENYEIRSILKFDNSNQAKIFEDLVEIVNSVYQAPPTIVVRSTRPSWINPEDRVVTDFTFVSHASVITKSELENPGRVIGFLHSLRTGSQRNERLMIPMLTYVAQLDSWSCLKTLSRPLLD